MKNILKIVVYTIVILGYISCSEDGINETGIGKLTGTVVSAGSNEPLKNVKITTTPSSTTVFTDEDGMFSIDEINSGDYSVQAELDDYITALEGTSIIVGVTSNVVFELDLTKGNNRPPTTPNLISPEDNSSINSSEVTFVWSASDPDEDSLTYTIELRNDKNTNVEYFENITDTTYTYSSLNLGVKYFWQIGASDGVNEPVLSAVKSFIVATSPTNYRYLFVRNIDGNNVIFTADEEGNEFQITSSSTNSFRPRRNVAANKIAYLQTNGAQVDVYTMNLDGTGKMKVTSSISPNGFNLNEINIAWPSNSEQIYFSNFDKLYSIGSNGQGLSLIYQTTDGSFISEIAVSASTNLIALKTNDVSGYNVSIFTINFNGTLLDTILSGVNGAVSGLDLSVNNQKILYSYDVDAFESPNYQRLNSRIFLYDIVTATVTDISGNKEAGTNDLDPRFSPNEASVIFTNTSNDGISEKNVVKLEIDQSNLFNTRVLLYNNAFMPDWE